MTANLTARIREAIAHGPRSVAQLAKLLKVSERIAASRVSQLKARDSAVLIYDRNPTRYVLASWIDARRRQKGEPPKERHNVAAPITIGRGSYWGAT